MITKCDPNVTLRFLFLFLLKFSPTSEECKDCGLDLVIQVLPVFLSSEASIMMKNK